MSGFPRCMELVSSGMFACVSAGLSVLAFGKIWTWSPRRSPMLSVLCIVMLGVVSSLFFI